MQDRKKEDQKESGWELKDHSSSYNKAEHSCTRRSKATAHSITLRKTTRKHQMSRWTFLANALVRNVSLVQVHNHLYGCPAERTPTAHGRHRVRTGRAKACVSTWNQSDTGSGLHQADSAVTSDAGLRWCRISVRWMPIAGDSVIVVGVWWVVVHQLEDLGVAYGVSSSSQKLQPAVTTVVELADTRQQTSPSKSSPAFSAPAFFSPSKWSCIFLNIGHANSGPAFSGPPFSAPQYGNITNYYY